jgi:hypothetical protein
MPGPYHRVLDSLHFFSRSAISHLPLASAQKKKHEFGTAQNLPLALSGHFDAL